jgi:hypothetical protein
VPDIVERSWFDVFHLKRRAYHVRFRENRINFRTRDRGHSTGAI